MGLVNESQKRFPCSFGALEGASLTFSAAMLLRFTIRGLKFSGNPPGDPAPLDTQPDSDTRILAGFYFRV